MSNMTVEVKQPVGQVIRVSQPGHGSNVDIDSSLTVAGAAADAKATGDVIRGVKEDLNDLKEQGIGGGSGIPQAQKTNFANAIRNEIAFVSTSHPYADAFLNWLESGSDTPVVPPSDEPTTPTLTGITVTWSADSADVGTNPSTLITSVKARYSDGTSQTVTGYSVSPTSLVEGTNTVTVTYQGKTATKVITGNALSTGFIEEYDKSVNGNNSTGRVDTRVGWCYTKALPFSGGRLNFFVAAEEGATWNSNWDLICLYKDNSYTTYYGYQYLNRLNYRDIDATKYPCDAVRFNLRTDYAEKSYAYDADGNILFAGSETEYFGKTNIND